MSPEELERLRKAREARTRNALRSGQTSLRVVAKPKSDAVVRVGAPKPTPRVKVATPRFSTPRIVKVKAPPQQQRVRVVTPKVKPLAVRQFGIPQAKKEEPSFFNRLADKARGTAGFISGITPAKKIINFGKNIYQTDQANKQERVRVQADAKKNMQELNRIRRNIDRAVAKGQTDPAKVEEAYAELDKAASLVTSIANEQMKATGLNPYDKRSIWDKVIGGASTLGQDITRVPLNILVENWNAYSPGKDLVIKTSDNKIAKGIFGVEDIAGWRAEGKRQFGSDSNLAMAGAMVFGVLDIVPGGKSVTTLPRGVLRGLAKADNATDIIKILKTGKYIDDIPVELVDDLAEQMAKAVNPRELEAIWQGVYKRGFNIRIGKYLEELSPTVKTSNDLIREFSKNIDKLPDSVVKVLRKSKEPLHRALVTGNMPKNSEKVLRALDELLSSSANRATEAAQQAAKRADEAAEVAKKPTPEMIRAEEAAKQGLSKGDEARAAAPVLDDTGNLPVHVDSKLPTLFESDAVDGKIAKLQKKSDAGQPEDGLVRVFQGTEKGMESPWVFNNIDDLRNFFAGRSKNVELVFKDVHPSTLQSTPNSPNIFKLTDGAIETSVSERVFDKLPKAIRDKIEQGITLSPQEAEKLAQKIVDMSEDGKQLEMGLGVPKPVKVVTALPGGATATRTTPSGLSKDIMRGMGFLTPEEQKVIRVFVSDNPKITSKWLDKAAGLFNLTGEELRPFLGVVNTISRKYPEMARLMEDLIFRPKIESARKADDLVRNWTGTFKTLKKTYGKASKSDTMLLSQALDGKLGKTSDEILVALRNGDNPQMLEAYADTFRRMYDETLDMLNKLNAQAGRKQIPKRENYFPHIKEILNENMFVQSGRAASDDVVTPLSRGAGFEKTRKNILKDIETDPFKVGDVYLQSAAGQVRSIIPARNLALIRDTLNDVGIGNPAGLERWEKFFRETQRQVTGAADVSNILTRLQGKFSQGVIAGNPSSALMNFVQPTAQAGFAPIKTSRALGATANTIISSILKGDNLLDNVSKIDGMVSDYMRAAFDAFENSTIADKSLAQKAGNFWSKTFLATDVVGRRTLLDSMYRDQLARGLSKADALKAAELQAESLLPSRVPGTLPIASRTSTAGRLSYAFQLEPIAQLESMIDASIKGGRMSKSGGDVVRRLAGASLSAFAFNTVFEQMFPGRRPMPDPIGWTIDSTRNDKEDRANRPEEFALEMVMNAAGQLPIVGSLSGKGISPLQIPLAGGFERAYGASKNILEGNRTPDDILALMESVGPFIGRGIRPVSRAVRGALAFSQGGLTKTKDGETTLETPVEQTPANLARMLAGGKYNTPEYQADKSGIEPVLDTAKATTLEEFTKASDQEKKELKGAYLTKDDEKILNLTNAEEEAAIQAGLITQSQVDQVKKKEEVFKQAQGEHKEEDVPKYMSKDGLATLNKYNRLSDKGKENYFEGNADAYAKKATGLVNSQKADGLPDFKANNALGFEYALWEKKYRNEKGNPIEQDQITKNFWKGAVNSQFEKTVQESYKPSASRIYEQVEKGNIGQKLMDEMIALDNMMVQSGVRKYPKFSNKWRREHGYGTIGKGSGGSGSSKKARIVVPKITNLAGSVSTPKIKTTRPRTVNFTKQFRPGTKPGVQKIKISR